MLDNTLQVDIECSFPALASFAVVDKIFGLATVKQEGKHISLGSSKGWLVAHHSPPLKITFS